MSVNTYILNDISVLLINAMFPFGTNILRIFNVTQLIKIWNI